MKLEEMQEMMKVLRSEEDQKTKAKLELLDKVKEIIIEADAYLSEEKLFKNTIKKDDLYHAKMKQFLVVWQELGF